MKMIEVFKQIKTNDKFFDFDFFHQTFFSKNMLVFGMSFTRAGYMEGLEEYDSKYRKLSFGSCIDDHILVRLRTLQEKGNLNNISFAYYDDISKQHYKRVISDFQLNANLIPSSEFDFHI